MKGIAFLILVFLSTSCCNCNYSIEDYELNQSELNFISSLSLSDTISFKNNSNEIISFLVSSVQREDKKKCGCFSAIPANMSFDVYIKNMDSLNNILQQNLLSITKWPQDKIIESSLSFMDFKCSLDDIADKKSDTIKLIDKNITNYYLFQSEISNSNITEIIWTDEIGLTAYKTRDGQYWVRQ